LALRIATGDVPPALQGVELHTLDMGLLQAGASVKGEFENRLKNVIDEVNEIGRFENPVVTTVALEKEFYDAEEYHQNYLKKKEFGLYLRKMK
jgi:subtilase family serine protease